MDLRDIITKKDLKEPYIFLVDFLEIEEIFKLEDHFKGRQVKFKKVIGNIEVEQPELCMLLCKEKAMQIARALRGSYVYFPKLQQNCLDKIKQMIISEFDGCNYYELSQKYSYSERHIKNIVNRTDKKRPQYPNESQLSLF